MCVTALKGGAGPTGGALCPWFLLCVFGSFLLQAVTETVDKKMITFPGPHHDLIHILSGSADYRRTSSVQGLFSNREVKELFDYS